VFSTDELASAKDSFLKRVEQYFQLPHVVSG
jgi:hypothetical protein